MIGHLAWLATMSLVVAVLIRIAFRSLSGARHRAPAPLSARLFASTAPIALARPRLEPVDAPPPESSPTQRAKSSVAPVPVTGVPGAIRFRSLRIVARTLGDVALVAALGFTIFVAYGLVGNRWYHVVAIEGGSMEPTINRGDLIVVTPPPSTIEPGMILVMAVDGRVVTHRVIAVRADGSLVTKGDANPIADEWKSHTILVYGQYQFAIPQIGRFLSISNGSGADFAIRATATQELTVGRFDTPPQPPLAATVRIEPQTINQGKDDHGGDVSVFVERLQSPHRLSEVVPASIVLCYRGACIPNAGAKLDGEAHVRATFGRSAVIGLVGEDRGTLRLTVRGDVTAYPSGFVGSDDVRISAGHGDSLAPAGGGGAPTGPPSSPPMPGEPAGQPTKPPGTPTPDPTASPTAEPAPEPTVEPTPEPTAEPTVEPTPEPTAEPTPAPTVEPPAEPTPAPTVEPTAEPTPEPAAQPTAGPTPEPTVEPVP